MASDSSIFIDSSVLIAAMMSPRGRARELLVLGIRGELRLMTSSLVLIETERNIAQKAPAALSAFTLLRQVIDPDLVEPSTVRIEQVSQFIHPKDAPIVAAAAVANADWLATYDRKHLLAQREIVSAQCDVSIATPDEILESLHS
jgi:predicted nucleic acid-binding protein